jgi:hypothetical protein
MKTRSSGNPVRSFASGLLFLGSIISVALVSAPALAVACRDINSVQQSANVEANTGMGGHLTQHILGMQPPPRTSQLGKTLFADKGKFEGAWRLYARITNPRSCTSGAVLQTFDLGHPIDAFSCRQADGEGRCTQWDSFHATQVSLGFLQVGGRWILNTAFPLPIP